MSHETRTVSPGPRARTVRDPDGAVRPVPDDWALLEPGDAGLTRRVKAAGPTWTVREKQGRRLFSRGVWAPAENIDRCRSALEGERETPEYQRRLAQGRARRAEAEERYAGDFEQSIREFLAFAPRHHELEERLARAVAAHAVPVGSGTVARTKRIPIEERAEAAVIAWMRHHSTVYDDMRIPRVKGLRRDVRRQLAQRSRALLGRYRRGEAAPVDCPLAGALASKPVAAPPTSTAQPQWPAAPIDRPRGGWARK